MNASHSIEIGLAKSILAGEPDEQKEARSKAIRKVTLFGDLYDRFGTSVTEDKIRIFLREKAGVEVTEATSLASEVGKLLKKNLPFIMSAKAGGTNEPTKQPLAGGKTLVESGVWELLTDSYGALRVVDDLSADFAIAALKKFKERFTTPTASQAGFVVVKSDAKKQDEPTSNS